MGAKKNFVIDTNVILHLQFTGAVNRNSGTRELEN